MITVSHSEMRCFKECRKKYFFAYRERLKPVRDADALVAGASYHAKIASIIKTGTVEETFDKTDAMARAFARHILPRLPFKETEKFFERQIAEDVRLIGYVDGILEDGSFVEHKSAGYPVDEKYIHRLAWDDQIPTYLMFQDHFDMWYTVCQKPSIRQTQKETLEQYIARCDAWYEDGTEQKIALFKVHRTEQELWGRAKEMTDLAHEMDKCEHFYRNPSACSIMGCPYESICLDYDPKFIIGFEKKEAYRGRDSEGE